eukprot:837706-Amphidinium_carterae.1
MAGSLNPAVSIGISSVHMWNGGLLKCHHAACHTDCVMTRIVLYLSGILPRRDACWCCRIRDIQGHPAARSGEGLNLASVQALDSLDACGLTMH